MDENIKFAFQKVKQDIDLIKEEISQLTSFLHQNQQNILDLNKNIQEISIQLRELSTIKRQSIQTNSPTDNAYFPSQSYNNPANNPPFKPLNPQNMPFSTGNEGVPTDRQTNQQTNQQTENLSLDVALDVLNSLDSIKKDIRNKFKRLTDQEFLVFSTIYQLSQNGDTDYRSISLKLNLTESSIRDYVGRLIKKGIPLDKIKLNNKTIKLSIPEKLTKVAPLPIILQLREL